MERLPFGVTTPSCVEVTRVPEISFIICIRIYICIHKYACVDFVDYCRFWKKLLAYDFLSSLSISGQLEVSFRIMMRSGRVRPEEIRSAAVNSGLEREFPEALNQPCAVTFPCEVLNNKIATFDDSLKCDKYVRTYGFVLHVPPWYGTPPTPTTRWEGGR